MKKRTNKDVAVYAVLLSGLLIAYGSHLAYKESPGKKYLEKTTEQENKISIYFINDYICESINIEKKEEENFKETLNSIIEEESKKATLKAFKQMQADKVVSYSIEDGENQVFRLLNILNEESVQYDIHYTSDILYPLYYDEIKIDKLENVNVEHLALGFDWHQKESLETFMNLFMNKLSKKDITLKDIYDWNLVSKYFSSWSNVEENWNEKYILELKEILKLQKKEFLSEFLFAEGATYEHFNPFTNEKTLPEIVLIDKFIPYENYTTVTLPKEIEDVYFEYMNHTLYQFGEYIELQEDNEFNNFYIYHDPKERNYVRIIIKKASIEKVLENSYTYEQKKYEEKYRLPLVMRKK